ncbi:inactive rhomboid protein 1-like protein [Dinothrombium tinctorium]|uniref:Inactive rhomboid protein 1-like protein n=1 Tax=Dinothrombium tinctorium TaxID=1965070 RepID=A0A3S4RGH7_9ACAR|nr:inactive rhomboid protein 1-like protein [Dinothrombium tinctorium]
MDEASKELMQESIEEPSLHADSGSKCRRAVSLDERRANLVSNVPFDAKRDPKESDAFDTSRQREGFDVIDGISVKQRVASADIALEESDEEPISKEPVYKLTLNGIVFVKNVVETEVDGIEKSGSFDLSSLKNFWKRKFKKNLSPEMKKTINDLDDHRPYFTYWVTTVQILVLVVAVFAYGFGPFGFTRSHEKGLVLVTSLSLQQVEYYQPQNPFVGPRAADLIHLGAKFAPCMRKDKLIFEHILEMRAYENETACCIRNDESGCVQTEKDKCSPLLSTWHRWSINVRESPPIQVKGSSRPRTSGSVCGQDPRFCEEPASAPPYEWPDDITQWPICRKPIRWNIREHNHMTCDLIGRPCCIGINGQCQITTRDHCDFLRGYFHEEATLCSQVSCLEDICGMIPFYSRDSPNQFYRLFISLFIHAGFFHLFITFLVQFYIMPDIEKLTGSTRIAIIYLVSGIGGNLASAIFVPYRAEVGPSGSQFGLLACLIVEVINSWEIIEKPKKTILKLLAIAGFLFVFGLLPWVDNYAHIFGFFIGFLLSLALLPYLTIKPYQKQLKITLIISSLFGVAVLFVLLFVLFYVFPVYECSWCQYFNCIPITDDWCADQDIKVKREDVL